MEDGEYAHLGQLPFKEFPKIYRLNREIIITEKIDGTNGCIAIGENGEFSVQSRQRIVTPDNDNFGFAKWAYGNKEELLKLGKGYHYGEWWGSGIQRGYGLPSGAKKFSLFNVVRWENNPGKPECCSTVPLLYRGLFNTLEIGMALSKLKMYGSYAAPFLNPEGIVIFHTHSNTGFKITLENDEKPKGEANV